MKPAVSKLCASRELVGDVLVIGGGLAGAMAAITAAQHGAKVVMLVKGRIGESGSSARAGGIIAAPFGHTPIADEEPWDDPSTHIADTLAAGFGLCSEAHVQALAGDARSGILKLERLGVKFSKMPDGRFHQLKAPGNSRPRACSVIGAGAALMAQLREQVQAHGVRLIEDTSATHLTVGDGVVVGAAAIGLTDNAPITVRARATVVATGGAAGLFQTISGDSRNTGDGLVMGYEACAELSNLEFVEFTLIYRVNGKVLKLGGLAPFLSRGGILVNNDGERFMERYYPPDVLARAVRSQILQAVMREIAEGRGPIFLDCTPVPESAWEEFERSQGALMLQKIRAAGGNYRNERIEVLPAAHSLLAGLVTNAQSATTLKGLWAAGECATGVHGAARLSGNGLAACLVFGRRAGQNAAHFSRSFAGAAMPRVLGRRAGPHIGHSDASPDSNSWREKISLQAEQCLGVVRDGASLEDGREYFRSIASEMCSLSDFSTSVELLETRHLCLLGELMTGAALLRKESRGLHFRTDAATSQEAWRKWLIVRKSPRSGRPYWSHRADLSIQEMRSDVESGYGND